MPKMLPRATSPVLALRVRKDIIAEKGQWLIVFPDESVEVLSEPELNMQYRSVPTDTRHHQDTNTPERFRLKRGKRNVGPSTVVNLGTKQIMLSYHIRLLIEALQKQGKKVLTTELSRALPEIKNMSAALDYAKKLGFVNSESAVTPRGSAIVWELNSDGKDVARKLHDVSAVSLPH